MIQVLPLARISLFNDMDAHADLNIHKPIILQYDKAPQDTHGKMILIVTVDFTYVLFIISFF